MKINDKFMGSIFTIGNISFNTMTAKPKDYKYYYDNGFSHLFEQEEKVVKKETINKLEQAKKEVKDYAKKKTDKR